MATITDLATASSLAGSDYLVVSQSGTDRKVAVSKFGLTSTGSWTPALRFGGGSTGLTYTSRYGYYTLLGNVYFVQCSITVSAVGSSTGNATIAGLPATASADATGAFWTGAAKWYDANANYVNMGAYVFAGRNYVDLTGITAAGSAWSEITHTAFKAGTQFQFSLFYFV